MTNLDIHLIMRDGVPLDINLRRTLFAMAQCMIERELESLSFEGVDRVFDAVITTEMKNGLHENETGILFRANISYGNESATEALFLARYLKDWRDLLVEKIEPATAAAKYFGIGGDPNTNWKN